ncbi:pyridoxamine 5'-phosphate oxidase family protein [soil metagenome]
MAIIDARTGLEQISERRCWELLAGTPIGRLGVTVDSAPEIYPVNFAVDDRSVVFRVTSGAKLDGLIRSASVCFEVDGIDVDDHTGWSVLVKGHAEHAVDGRRLDALGLRPWAPGAKPTWIRIIPRAITGRRLRPS